MDKKHSHCFVEEYNGLVGFGLDRETDEHTITYYLQKFSDDSFIELIRKRFSQSDLDDLFNLLNHLMKEHLSEKEYHQYFLKD